MAKYAPLRPTESPTNYHAKRITMEKWFEHFKEGERLRKMSLLMKLLSTFDVILWIFRDAKLKGK